MEWERGAASTTAGGCNSQRQQPTALTQRTRRGLRGSQRTAQRSPGEYRPLTARWTSRAIPSFDVAPEAVVVRWDQSAACIQLPLESRETRNIVGVFRLLSECLMRMFSHCAAGGRPIRASRRASNDAPSDRG